MAEDFKQSLRAREGVFYGAGHAGVHLCGTGVDEESNKRVEGGVGDEGSAIELCEFLLCRGKCSTKMREEVGKVGDVSLGVWRTGVEPTSGSGKGR